MNLKPFLLVLSLVGCAAEKPPIVVPVILPYDCGILPPADKFTALPAEADAAPSTLVNPLLNIEDILARTKQLQARVLAYENCIAKSKEQSK